MAVLPPDPVFTLKSTSMGFIHCLCFPPPMSGTSPNKLLAGSEAGKLFVWSLDTNRIQNQFEVGPSLLSIQHTSDMMITQEKLGKIKIWQRDNECQYTQLGTINSGVGFCRTILAQDKYIASAQENSIVEIHDFKTQTKVCSFIPDPSANYGNVMTLHHFNANGNDYIISGYESGDILLWDPKNPSKFINHIKLRECLTAMDFDIANYRGVVGNASNYLQVLDVERGTFNMSLKCELAMTNPGCNVVRIRHDRKVFVTGGADGSIRIYSWKSLRPLTVLTEHKGSINDITFSVEPIKSWKTKNLMAAGDRNGLISLWDLYN